jgi:hypothetical protein
MGETLRDKRDGLNEALYELLLEAGVEILDHEYETTDEWGFIECLNKNNEEVKFVFNDNNLEMYVDGILKGGI